ncbi:hypothetical protein, partial [Paenibacillus taichungensis]|uniref:hypothetical protein n=1 Tax=Paenibacillus taichungensis TaxID=484184 RepID=UPI002870EA3C
SIEKSDKLILKLTRLKISFYAPVDPSQGLSLTFAFILQAECLLTRCSVFKDQTCFIAVCCSPQQLLYLITSEPTLQALF